MESIKKGNAVSRAFIYAALIICSILVLSPFIWMLSSSFKPNNDIFRFPIEWIPSTVRLENYVDIWTQLPMLTFFKNTAVLTVIITILQILTSAMAGYAFSKINFPGRSTMFLAYIATMSIPWQVYMIPQFIMVKNMGLSDTLLAMVLLQAFTPLGTFLMRQAYMSIPNELLEAARVDGLNDFGIFTKIMLPLVKPTIATLTIITSVYVWNDFMGPLIYLTSTENKTIQLGLRMFVTQYSAEYGLILAASVCSVIPLFIVFVSCQKFFIEGIATSGLKG